MGERRNKSKSKGRPTIYSMRSSAGRSSDDWVRQGKHKGEVQQRGKKNKWRAKPLRWCVVCVRSIRYFPNSDSVCVSRRDRGTRREGQGERTPKTRRHNQSNDAEKGKNGHAVMKGQGKERKTRRSVMEKRPEIGNEHSVEWCRCQCQQRRNCNSLFFFFFLCRNSTQSHHRRDTQGNTDRHRARHDHCPRSRLVGAIYGPSTTEERGGQHMSKQLNVKFNFPISRTGLKWQYPSNSKRPSSEGQSLFCMELGYSLTGFLR